MVQEAFIDIVEVQPAYQKRGIGTALVEKVIAWARDNEISQVRAWSEEIRHEALMLCLCADRFSEGGYVTKRL